MRLKISCIALLAATAIAFHPAFAEGPRNIEFAGILWGLRQTSGPVDPGPNTFSNAEDLVWVDGGGRLHLMLQERDGIRIIPRISGRSTSSFRAGGIHRPFRAGSPSSLTTRQATSILSTCRKRKHTTSRCDGNRGL